MFKSIAINILPDREVHFFDGNSLNLELIYAHPFCLLVLRQGVYVALIVLEISILDQVGLNSVMYHALHLGENTDCVGLEIDI